VNSLRLPFGELSRSIFGRQAGSASSFVTALRMQISIASIDPALLLAYCVHPQDGNLRRRRHASTKGHVIGDLSAG